MTYLLIGSIYTLTLLLWNIKRNTVVYQAMQYKKNLAVLMYLVTIVIWPIDMAGYVLIALYRWADK